MGRSLFEDRRKTDGGREEERAIAMKIPRQDEPFCRLSRKGRFSGRKKVFYDTQTLTNF
jgi:hypothetical protein